MNEIRLYNTSICYRHGRVITRKIRLIERFYYVCIEAYQLLLVVKSLSMARGFRYSDFYIRFLSDRCDLVIIFFQYWYTGTEFILNSARFKLPRSSNYCIIKIYRGINDCRLYNAYIECVQCTKRHFSNQLIIFNHVLKSFYLVHCVGSV